MAFESRTVPKDWKFVVIVFLDKVKDNQGKCKNYKGMNLLSIVGKVYNKIPTDRVQNITAGIIVDEQNGFRQGVRGPRICFKAV